MQPIELCTVKILGGGTGQGWWYLLYPSPYEQLFITPNPHHPTLSIFHCYPLPFTILASPLNKNFDHTHCVSSWPGNKSQFLFLSMRTKLLFSSFSTFQTLFPKIVNQIISKYFLGLTKKRSEM